MSRNESGYTIPELLVTLILIGLFSTLLLTFMFGYWRYGAIQEADLDTLVTRLNASDYLREQIGTSSGLIMQNSIQDANTLKPDPAIPSNLYWLPIHAIPGTATVSGTGVTPLLYYRRYSINSTKAIITNGTTPYEDEFILYINNATAQLMVRSLANTGATGKILKTSCPPSLATSTCPADKVIASNIKSIASRYFSRAGNPIDYTSIYDNSIPGYIGPDFSVAEVVEITLNLQKKPFLQQTQATINSTIIRIALRNT